MYGPGSTKGYQGRGFQALSTAQVYVLGTDGNLWSEISPWGTVPPPERWQVDGDVAAFQALSPGEVYVLGTNTNLWHETGPRGAVPPARHQVDDNVLNFQAVSGIEAYIQGTDSLLCYETGPWGIVPPQRVQVDANVWPDNGITTRSYPNVSDSTEPRPFRSMRPAASASRAGGPRRMILPAFPPRALISCTGQVLSTVALFLPILGWMRRWRLSRAADPGGA
jgi:hypothetical protein